MGHLCCPGKHAPTPRPHPTPRPKAHVYGLERVHPWASTPLITVRSEVQIFYIPPVFLYVSTPHHSPPKVPALIIGHAREVLKEQVRQGGPNGAIGKARHSVPSKILHECRCSMCKYVCVCVCASAGACTCARSCVQGCVSGQRITQIHVCVDTARIMCVCAHLHVREHVRKGCVPGWHIVQMVSCWCRHMRSLHPYACTMCSYAAGP